MSFPSPLLLTLVLVTKWGGVGRSSGSQLTQSRVGAHPRVCVRVWPSSVRFSFDLCIRPSSLGPCTCLLRRDAGVCNAPCTMRAATHTACPTVECILYFTAGPQTASGSPRFCAPGDLIAHLIRTHTGTTTHTSPPYAGHHLGQHPPLGTYSSFLDPGLRARFT